jgi:hypothetical protein
MAADYFGREAVFSPDGMTLIISADGVDDRYVPCLCQSWLVSASLWYCLLLLVPLTESP